MDKSVLDITLHTCNRTEKPPNPNKNDVTIICNGSTVSDMVDISLIPLVISNIPNITYSVHVLPINDNIPDTCSIDIIKEKSITNPHTMLNVWNAFFIVSPTISPRVENSNSLEDVGA